MVQKFRQKTYFRGPVYLKNVSGLDISFLDDQTLNFGNSNDFVVDWDNTGGTGLAIVPAAAGSAITVGTSTYYTDLTASVNDVAVNLYGTNADININRNLSAASTNAPVVYIRQQHATDDQPAVQIISAGTGAGINLDGALDVDGQSAYVSGALVDINRNLGVGSTDNVVVYIRQQSSTDDQAAVQIVQAGAGVGLNLDGALDIDGQSAFVSGALVDIDRNLGVSSTDNVVVYIRQQSSTDDRAAVQIVQAGAAAGLDLDGALDIDGQAAYVSGALVDIQRNYGATNTDNVVVYIKQDSATDDQAALQVVSDGTGVAANIDGPVDLDHGTTVTTGATLDVQRNLGSTNTNTAVVYIKQDSMTDDQVALQVVQDGVNIYAVDIDGSLDVQRDLGSTNTNNPVAYIKQDSTTDDKVALQVVQDAAYAALDVDGTVDIDGVSGNTSDALVNINRNLSAVQTGDAVVYIRQQHATDDQAALQVISAGTGVAANIDGPVDVDHGTTVTTGSTLDVNRDLGATNTAQAVAYIKQDSTTDDQPCLTLVNDATVQLTLDAQGWCNVGYTTTQNTQSTVGTGAVRLINVNSKWFWQVHTGSGTYKYIEISSSTTA